MNRSQRLPTKEQIDEALLRKGRLIVEHEFGKLPANNVEKLFKHLNIKHEEEDVKEMTLTDVYNFAEENFAKSDKKNSTLGFR